MRVCIESLIRYNSAVTESMKAKDAQTEGHFNGCGESGATY